MTIFTYSRVSAFNPNTSPVSLARSAAGSVYDTGDTGFTTPLNMTMVATGTVTTTLLSDASGMFPDFTLVDRPSVVFKSGAQKFVLTTTTPVPGPKGDPGPASTVPGPPTTDASLLTAGTVADARLPQRLQDDQLSATYGAVLRLESQPGVDPNGVTECAAAVQTAIDLAQTKGIPLVSGKAFYKIATGLTLKDNADLSPAVFTYTGTTGTAFTVLDAVRKTIKLPYVTASAKTVTGWAQVAGTVGVKIQNVNSCDIWIRHTSNFEVGVLLYGNNAGVSYNEIHLGEIGQHKIAIDFNCTATGWTNGNDFHGGRISLVGEGTSVAGTRYVRMQNSAPFVADDNHFIGTSMESPGDVEYVIESYGWYNTWKNCRWESYGEPGTKRVWFRGTAKGNVISDGYEAEKLTMTQDAGTANNRIQSPFVDQSIVLQPGGLEPVGGAPTLATTGSVRYWTLGPTAADEVAAELVLIPANWQKVSVKLIWYSQGGGAGNVALNIKYQTQNAGNSAGFPGFQGVGGPFVSGAASVITETTIRADLPVTPGYIHISALRDGADVGDTMAGNICLLGIVLTRVA